MDTLVHVTEGLPTTTSKLIADAFNKNHRDVLRAIKNIECSDKFRERNLTLSSYTSPQNKILPCYEVTKDGLCFLLWGSLGHNFGGGMEREVHKCV